MIGVELDRPGGPIVDACREAGLLVNCTADRVIRLLPPFILPDSQASTGLAVLKKVFVRIHADRRVPLSPESGVL